MKKVKEEVLLSGKEILKEAVKETGTTQKALGERLGMLQTAVSAGFARERISLDMFSRLLSGMGYAVAVIDKKDGNVRWVVDTDK